MAKHIAKKKCEMWISNNKVLTGGSSKKPHARNPNFETEETKLLISLWGDPKVQKTLITTHKKHPVIVKLADKMREHGYYRSAEEINTRIKNLKCFYNRIKKDIELGIITEPTWKHYSSMEEIINRPIFGNRVQQPHLQHLHLQQQKQQQQQQGTQPPASAPPSSKSAAESAIMREMDDDTSQLRPEDLLSVEEGDDGTEMDFEDTVLVPKDEPIDMEDGDDDNDDQSEIEDVDLFPKLSQYLQLASTTTSQNDRDSPESQLLIDIKHSPPSTPTPSECTPPPPPPLSPTPILPQSSTSSSPALSAAIPPIPPGTQLKLVMSAATAPCTNTTTSQQTTNNKISLVPTNYLMKPQHQAACTTSTAATISFNQQLFGAAAAVGKSIGNVAGQTVYTTTTNSGVPMKVLLVNALQKPTPTVVSTSGGSGGIGGCGSGNAQIQIMPNKTTTIGVHATRLTTTQSNHHGGTNTVGGGKNIMMVDGTANGYSNLMNIVAGGPSSSHNNTECNNKMENKNQVPEVKPQKGFRVLLNTLVKAQAETLNLARQRLEVEKRRFEYEQNVGDKLLAVLQTIANK